MTYKTKAKKAFKLFKSFFDYDQNSDWLIDDEIEQKNKGEIEFLFSFEIKTDDGTIKLTFAITESGILRIYNVKIPESIRRKGVITKTFGSISGIKKVLVVDSYNDDAWNAIFSKLGLIDRMVFTS